RPRRSGARTILEGNQDEDASSNMEIAAVLRSPVQRAAPPITAAILGATIYDWFHRRNWLRIARGRLADGDPDGTRDRRSAGRPPLSQPTVKFSSSAGPRAMSVGVWGLRKLRPPPEVSLCL